jgi:NAD(P)-dependent dehydrogenase (short-subunit alcohol dehydrogenase family)
MRAQKLRPVSESSPGRGETRGVIVNLCSASSLRSAWGIIPYTTSKHAQVGLTTNSGEWLLSDRPFSLLFPLFSLVMSVRHGPQWGS